jgi:hypothetical protein
VSLFAKKDKDKKVGVQSFVLKLVNTNCRDLRDVGDGPRVENRVPLVLVTMVVPFRDRPLAAEAFATVTIEFTTSGLSVLMHGLCPYEKVVLAFRNEGTMHYLLAETKHLNPLGAGMFQLGLQLVEILRAADYPELQSVYF